jgi:hypothetical protein
MQEGTDKPRHKVEFVVGEYVRVKDGPFTDFNGTVEEVNYEKEQGPRVGDDLRSCHAWWSLRIQPGRKNLIRAFALSQLGAETVCELLTPGSQAQKAQLALSPARSKNMAKKIVGFIKLQVPAGKANPSPPIGPALGQRGLNIMEFCKAFNAQTQGVEPGLPLPVVITAFADKSFTFIIKTPPATT